MPIHFEDLDVVPEVAGMTSALIVPCGMCPAVTVAAREGRPFLQLLRNPLKSAPFERYLEDLRRRLEESGVATEVFRSLAYHEWFMCMWTSGKRGKLRRRAARHDAVIVLGCESATRTVRDAVGPDGCKVVEGMAVAGIMNAELRFRWPGDVSFAACRTVPISRLAQPGDGAG